MVFKSVFVGLMFISSFLYAENMGVFVPEKHVFQLDYPNLPEEVIYRIHGKTIPETTFSKIDPLLKRDWALLNIGFFESFTKLVKPILSTVKPCSPKVIVAVIDTGIDYTHQELKHSLWVNSGEIGSWEPATYMEKHDYDCHDKSCNGIDNDKNGFVNDVVGWDFVHDMPLPYDTHGHGTHISGIIAAAAANGIGSSGICPTVTLMPLKYYDNVGAGYSNLTNTIRAIKYAVKMGAHIINYSGGGSDPSSEEKSAILEAQKKGVLLIAAAGNEGRNNDRVPYYPASYNLDNIISVTSVDKKNEFLSSSNYGKSVHLAAPGMVVLSTLPRNTMGTMSGTSQSTAFVSGAAALLASQYDDDPRKHYKDIRKALILGSKPLKINGPRNIILGGLLNVPKALETLQKLRKEKHH